MQTVIEQSGLAGRRQKWTFEEWEDPVRSEYQLEVVDQPSTHSAIA